MKEVANVYYYKGFLPKAEVDMKDYELVCKHPVFRAPGHKDTQILEALFELFNWVHEGFQPNDKEIGFNKSNEVYHTSMSVGDIIEINGVKYLCQGGGWKKLEA
jgi:hypothetical protein